MSRQKRWAGHDILLKRTGRRTGDKLGTKTLCRNVPTSTAIVNYIHHPEDLREKLVEFRGPEAEPGKPHKDPERASGDLEPSVGQASTSPRGSCKAAVFSI